MAKRNRTFPWKMHEAPVSASNLASGRVYTSGQNDCGILLEDGDSVAFDKKEGAFLFEDDADELWLRTNFSTLYRIPCEGDEMLRKKLFGMKRAVLFFCRSSGIESIPDVRVFTNVSISTIIGSEKHSAIINMED